MLRFSRWRYIHPATCLKVNPTEHCGAAAHALAPLALALASCVKPIKIKQKGTGNVRFRFRNKAQMSPVQINKAHA